VKRKFDLLRGFLLKMLNNTDECVNLFTSYTATELLWRYTDVNYPILLGPLGIILVHELTYFGTFLPYYIADFIPSLRKYKLQQDKFNDAPTMWRCFKTLMFLHFCIEAPMILISHPIFQTLGFIKTTPLPSWTTLITAVLFCFFVEDFYFYWFHRFLHWQRIYKYVHKIHHEHAAPFGIAAEYAHPLETIFLGVGTALGPFLISAYCGLHLFTLLFWLFVRVIQTVEVHTGYNFPWSLNNWLPFWGGAEFHDYHHMAFTNNYASTFTIWDRVFGTNDKYLKFKKDQTCASPSEIKKA